MKRGHLLATSPRPSIWSEVKQKRTASYGEDDYRWVVRPPTYIKGDVDALYDEIMAWRRRCVHEREYWLGQKKARGRFAKDEAAWWMKAYRGACLIIGWYFAPEDMGDCPVVEPYHWPDELAQCAVIAARGGFDVREESA